MNTLSFMYSSFQLMILISNILLNDSKLHQTFMVIPSNNLLHHAPPFDFVPVSRV